MGREKACWLRCSRRPTHRQDAHTEHNKPLAIGSFMHRPWWQILLPGLLLFRARRQPQGQKSQRPQRTVQGRSRAGSSAHTIGTATGRAHTHAQGRQQTAGGRGL
jgi:hypothetical protein